MVMKSSNNMNDDTIITMNIRDKNGEKHLIQSVKPYEQTSKYQSPIEQQNDRLRLNFIIILISLFLLISVSVGVYQILGSFIDINVLNKRNCLIETLNSSNKTH